MGSEGEKLEVDITEEEAKAMIEKAGLRYKPKHLPNHAIAGLRFSYVDPEAPVPGGAIGHGRTRRQAALGIIGHVSHLQPRG